MNLQVSVWFDFESIGYTLRSHIAELYGRSIFNSLKQFLKGKPGIFFSLPCLSRSEELVLNLPSMDLFPVLPQLPSRLKLCVYS